MFKSHNFSLFVSHSFSLLSAFAFDSTSLSSRYFSYQLIFFFLTAKHSLWDLNSLTGDGNSVSVEVQSPNHWTSREFPSYFFLFSHVFFFPSSLLFSSFYYVMVNLSFFIFFHSNSCGSIGPFSLTLSNPRLQLILFRISFTLQKTKQNKPK